MGYLKDKIAQVAQDESVPSTQRILLTRGVEVVIDLFCHGLRLPALAVIFAAFAVSALMVAAMTEQGDRMAEVLVNLVGEDIYETHDFLGLGRLFVMKYGLYIVLVPIVLSFAEQVTGIRIRRLGILIPFWTIVFALFFGAGTIYAIRNAPAEEEVGFVFYVVVSVLNGMLLLMAAIGVAGLWAISRAEEGTLEALGLKPPAEVDSVLKEQPEKL